MARDYLTDEQVLEEVERLRTDKYVKLARREQALKNRQRQYMYTLRNLEKRGKELARLGITEQKLEEIYSED